MEIRIGPTCTSQCSATPNSEAAAASAAFAAEEATAFLATEAVAGQWLPSLEDSGTKENRTQVVAAASEASV